MVATCAPGIPFALRHAVFGIERIARRTAGLRAAAMAKSAPAARAAPATSAENSPESARSRGRPTPVSYTHLRAHETPEHLVCRLLLEKKKKKNTNKQINILNLKKKKKKKKEKKKN